MAKKPPPPMPSLDVPLIDPATGQINQAWYVYFQSRQTLAGFPDVDVTTTVPLSGQVLVWDAVNKVWHPAAN